MVAAPWRIRQFGAVKIEGPGFEPFETQRSAKILTLLALVRHGKMRREDLADALWPDDFYDATRLRLRKELSRLRQALGPAADALETDGESVALDRRAFETDVEILRRAVTLPESDPRRLVRLREAVEASNGPFLPGWDDPWVVAERHAADSLRCRALVPVAESLLAGGDAEGALATVRQAIEIDPCHEAARMVAIRAHAALGSLVSAVGEFQQMKRLMRERHDRTPSIDAEALLLQVQEGNLERESKTRLPAFPSALGRFFGRHVELSTLRDALSPAAPDRLVTLVGTGGIGKSRLAIEAAHSLRDVYQGNIALISLAESPSAEAAAATLLAHLGWQGSAVADPVSVVASSLPPGPCLFVLDNLEHLLPDASDLVRRLLQSCPNLKALATSRQALRIEGERILALGPLGEAGSEMLADLARGVRPGLAEDPDLAELARRLDGIPLALRLVAPRLRVLGPKALLARLGDRFQLLQGDAPDLPLRHRSLRAALDGSFEGLDDRERRALIQMSPFRGGWTLAHLERLLPGEDGLQTMEALVDASLVAIDDAGPAVRFTMLETVREYVNSREDTSAARKEFVRTISTELRERLPDTLTPRSLALLDLIDAEADNLHLAVEAGLVDDPGAARTILSRLWIYDTIRGRHGDLERLHREFAKAHPNAEFDPAAEFGRAMALAGLNRTLEASASFSAVEQSCLASGDLEDAALVAAMLLVSERRLGRITFEDTFDRIGVLKVQAGNSPLVVGRFALMEGDLLFYARRLEEAASRLDQAQKIAREVGDEVGEIIAVHLRGFVLLDLGAREDVRRELAEIAPRVERLGDPGRRGVHHELQGRMAMRIGASAEALAHFQRSRDEWSRLGNAYQIADQDNSISRALLGLGRFDDARVAARDAFRGWSSADDLGGVAVSLHSLTAIRLALGEFEKASAALATARSLTAAHGLEFVLNEVQFLESLVARTDPTAVSNPEAETLFSA